MIYFLPVAILDGLLCVRSSEALFHQLLRFQVKLFGTYGVDQWFALGKNANVVDDMSASC